MTDSIKLGNVEIELKKQGDKFLGLGEVKIGGTVVRSGDLPMRPFTATHDGIEYSDYVLENVEADSKKAVLTTKAIGKSASIHAVLDHSLDPVWDTRPWDGRELATDRMEWILEARTQTIGGKSYEGFAYSFRFRSESREIYYILDRSTWEIGGEATDVTLLRQQMGEDPLVKIEADTNYSTAGEIGFPLNPIMTHDVPRWASEQGFDFQHKNGDSLIGVFDNCGLIRTIVIRNPGDPSIRHFDKHIFDQTNDAATVTKFIGLAKNVGDYTDQINAWTAVFDADQDNVLGEFGMTRTYALTTLSHNFWHDFTADSYRVDLIPAAAALGFQQVFIDTFWENDMTYQRSGRIPAQLGGNMCCPHEYEVSQVVGGIEGYKRLVEDARELGVELISWIGSHQSFCSRYLQTHRAQIIKQADGRHWWGSGYDEIYGMDLTTSFGDMFGEKIEKGAKDTTISGFLYDSFFNFGWMAVNHFTPDPNDPDNPNAGTLKAHTQWRRLAELMAQWQKAGMHMLIESLGPWGQPQHGVQGAYNKPGSEPLAYQCAVNVGYSVIPTPETSKGDSHANGPEAYYKMLANKAPTTLNLWTQDANGKKVRLDKVASPIIRQANLDYRKVLPLMHTRTLLRDNAGVAWAPKEGDQQVLFSYKQQMYAVPAGTPYVDQTTGEKGEAGADGIAAEALHTYVIG